MGDGDQQTTQPGSEEELRGGRGGEGGTRTCIVAVVLKN